MTGESTPVPAREASTKLLLSLPYPSERKVFFRYESIMALSSSSFPEKPGNVESNSEKADTTSGFAFQKARSFSSSTLTEDSE